MATTDVTITGGVFRAISNVPWVGRVDVAVSAYGEDEEGFLSDAQPNKVDPETGGLNGAAGVTLTVPDTNTVAVTLGFVSVDSDDVETVASSAAFDLDDSDTSADLATLVVGAAPGAGGEIVVSGALYRPFNTTPWTSENDSTILTNAPWTRGQVLLELLAAFVTADGVYPPCNQLIKLDSEGNFAGSGGLTVWVPEGVASEWRFTFPDGTVRDCFLDASMSDGVLIGDVLAGQYASWNEPMDAPANPQLAVGGASRDQVTFTWDDNSSDETGFEVEYYDGTWKLLTTTAAGVETYTHTTAHGTHPLNLGLATLRYRVRAVKSGGASAWATKTETTKGLLFRLKAAYNLDEASGTRANILGGFSLTQEVGAAGSATGLIGDAVDGSDNVRLSNDNYTIPSGTPFAIALWVYWGGSSGADHRITGLYPNATGELLEIQTASTTTLRIGQVNGANATLADVDLAEWNLIVFGYDGTNTVYSVNGAAKQTLYAGAWPQDWSRLWVGSENTNSTYLVDLLNWYYDHFPSAAQLTALYNDRNGRAHPY